jgi:hypothetical protein
MAKSIHFNQVPNMRGRLTMPFTDVTAENFKPRILKAIHAREMRDWRGDVYERDEAEFDAYLASGEYLASWDC